ncbi:MAG: tetratricopeptide repeat protein, partial [Desulfocucumaceae bacterium]
EPADRDAEDVLEKPVDRDIPDVEEKPAGRDVPDVLKKPAGWDVPDVLKKPTGRDIPDVLKKPAGRDIPDVEEKPAGRDAKDVLKKPVSRDTAGIREQAAPDGGDNAWRKLFTEAVELHRRGIEGDREAVARAYELLVEARKMAPDNHLVEAYYGSITALLGRDAVDPTVRVNKALKGLKILDKAVLSDPENIEIRILRASVNYRLPEKFFHRTNTAIEDFSYLIKSYKNDPSVFSKEFYWQILCNLAVSYQRLERRQEAEAVYASLLSETPDNKYLDLLRQEGFEAPHPDQADHSRSPVSPEVTIKIEEMLQKGTKFHGLALKGDKEALKKAMSFFKKASAEYPDNQLFKAYYADCWSLTARDTMDPGQMFSIPMNAAKMLDSAVNGCPEDLRIRMIRAYHSFRLPEAFFRRTATAIADFEHLARINEEDRSAVPRESYWQILFDLGAAYERLGLEEESLSTWKKLLSLDPDPEYKALIDEKRGHDLPGGPVRQFSPDDRESLYQEGFRLHDLGVSGNRAAAKMALELWKNAYEANPKDTVARAYFGSSMALVGRDSSEPNAMFGSAIKGLVHLNRAISRDRNNHRIRLLRGYLCYSLPEVFFHQTGRAIKDFKFLKMSFEQDDSVFSRELYHKILYDLGMAYQHTGDGEKAKKVWSKLLKEEADSKYKALLNERVETGHEDESEENTTPAR